MDNKNRRSHKFIDRWAQLRIAGEVVLYAVTYVSLLAMILFVPPFVTMFSTYTADDHQAVAKELFDLNFTKWPLFLLLAVFVGIASILFSHRIVGPGYQLGRGLHELEDGNLGIQLKFRKFDFLTELQDTFNRTVLKLKADFGTLHQEYENANNALREIRNDGASPERIAKLETHLSALEKTLKTYRGLS